MLTTPVAFLARVLSANGLGANVPSWPAVSFTTMAHEEVGSAGEGSEGDQDASASRIVFWIRWRPDVANTMRCRRGEQTLEVSAVDPVGRRDFLRVTCERINDG